MPALRFAAILAWAFARVMILAFYMGAFAIAGSLALQRTGYESDLVTVYLPALLAMPLF